MERVVRNQVWRDPPCAFFEEFREGRVEPAPSQEPRGRDDAPRPEPRGVEPTLAHRPQYGGQADDRLLVRVPQEARRKRDRAERAGRPPQGRDLLGRRAHGGLRDDVAADGGASAILEDIEGNVSLSFSIGMVGLRPPDPIGPWLAG